MGNIDLEVDGEQHYYDKRIVASDNKRTKYLESLGFSVIRIRWSHFCKLNFDARAKYIDEILLNGKHIDINVNFSNDKKLERINAAKLNINNRRKVIEDSNIDTRKYGWSDKLSKEIGITSAALVRWIRKYMPDFYNTCKKNRKR
jgi:hypothetical protein